MNELLNMLKPLEKSKRAKEQKSKRAKEQNNELKCRQEASNFCAK